MDHQFQSPFLSQISHCRNVSRKLKKKIHKYSCRHPNIAKKSKTQINDIIGILERRKVTTFVTEELKKKRVIDIFSMSNVQIPFNIERSEITEMSRSQEQEVKEIFEQHQQRMKNKEKVKNTMKLENKLTYYSLSDNQARQNNEFQQKYNLSLSNFIGSEELANVKAESFLEDKEIYCEEMWLRF